MIRIAGDDKPFEVVKGKRMKLNSDYIRFILMCMKENTAQVRICGSTSWPLCTTPP